MFWLAEELRVVGGNEIHQMLDFLRATVGPEHGAILIIASQPQRPQALAQPVGQHGVFVRAKLDTAVLEHQVRQCLVSPGRQSGRDGRIHAREPDPARSRLRSS